MPTMPSLKPIFGRPPLIGENRTPGNCNCPEMSLLKLELKTMRVDAVVAKTEFVHQRWAEHVGFAQREAAICVVFDSIEEPAAVEHIVKGGNKTSWSS